ncbi:hypothetical protein ACFYQ5_04820 [Streptomyces sp. NPDC005794]|uniref:hypothetical protein n=1 Tax=Streptomyces sp. NPDC005794 TaxID=3364733 RepID=UPI00367CB3F1
MSLDSDHRKRRIIPSPAFLTAATSDQRSWTGEHRVVRAATVVGEDEFSLHPTG